MIRQRKNAGIYSDEKRKSNIAIKTTNETRGNRSGSTGERRKTKKILGQE